MIRGLNLPGTPTVTSAYRGTSLLLLVKEIMKLEETLLDLLTFVEETFVFYTALCPCLFNFCRQGECKN